MSIPRAVVHTYRDRAAHWPVLSVWLSDTIVAIRRHPRQQETPASALMTGAGVCRIVHYLEYLYVSFSSTCMAYQIFVRHNHCCSTHYGGKVTTFFQHIALINNKLKNTKGKIVQTAYTGLGVAV